MLARGNFRTTSLQHKFWFQSCCCLFLMEQYDKSWVNMGHAHVFMYIYICMHYYSYVSIYSDYTRTHTHTNCTYIHTIHTYAHLEKRKTVTLLIIRVAPTYKKVNDSQTGVKLVSFPPFSEVHLSSYMRSASVKGDFGSLYLKALAFAEGPIGWAESHRKRLWIDSLRLLVVLSVFSCYFPPYSFQIFSVQPSNSWELLADALSHAPASCRIQRATPCSIQRMRQRALGWWCHRGFTLPPIAGGLPTNPTRIRI